MSTNRCDVNSKNSVFKFSNNRASDTGASASMEERGGVQQQILVMLARPDMHMLPLCMCVCTSRAWKRTPSHYGYSIKATMGTPGQLQRVGQ